MGEMVVDERNEEYRGTKKTTSRKNGSWEVGDDILVQSAFRYRGDTGKRHRIMGVGIEVTYDWVWFKVSC